MTGVTARWTTCVGIAVSMALLASLFATPASASRVGRWTNLDPPASPRGVTWPAVAYDSESDRTILFGGDRLTYTANGTWAYSFVDNQWQDMSTPWGLWGRHNPALAYDSESDRVILYGGGDLAPHFYDDGTSETWAYDFNTNTWTRRMPAQVPPPRWGTALAYDSRADRVIMFGGCVSVPDFCGAANDTWSYDFNSDTWTRLTPAVSPPIRYRHGMAYDPPSDRVILFGGSGGTGPLGDTWAYDFIANAWTLLSARGGPPPLSNVAAAYDVRADRVIVFGDGNGSDAWAYDVNMNAWTDLGLTIPPALGALTAAYDDRADRTVVFTGDTLALDSARNSIVNRDPPQIPYPFTSGIAYDASADRVIALTTDHGSWPQPVLSATWSFDDVRDRWVNRRPVVSPPAVASAALVYDSRHARTILFGGYLFAPPYRPQTWAYDHRANRWTELAPTISPSLRSDHVMAYDSRSDKVILFGGCCAPALMADTWAYDFTTNRWAEMTPPVSPSAREYSAMAYDSESDRVILFGGSSGPLLGDTWAYDYGANRWTRVGLSGGPAARQGHSMVYDERADRIVLLGGYLGYAMGPDNRTWEYDFNSDLWENVTTIGTPPLGGGRMAYDSASNRVILWAGPSETWAYASAAGGPPMQPGAAVLLVGVVVIAVIAASVFLLVYLRGRKRGGSLKQGDSSK